MDNLKINSVTFVTPDDPTGMIESYSKAVAQVLIRKVPPEGLDLLIAKLEEVYEKEKQGLA